jgi:hypothetical protein
MNNINNEFIIAAFLFYITTLNTLNKEYHSNYEIRDSCVIKKNILGMGIQFMSKSSCNICMLLKQAWGTYTLVSTLNLIFFLVGGRGEQWLLVYDMRHKYATQAQHIINSPLSK